MAGKRTKNLGDIAGTPSLQTFGNNQCQWVVLSAGQIGMEKMMQRTARIGLPAALFLGGATIAMAQNGPPPRGYPPAPWEPEFLWPLRLSSSLQRLLSCLPHRGGLLGLLSH